VQAATRSDAASSGTSMTARSSACLGLGSRSSSLARSSPGDKRRDRAPRGGGDELRAALDELRELARGIHPAILTDQGLGAALRSLAERCPVPVNIAAVPEERLGESVEAATYFLVSESLVNCAKYAHASAVRVSITRRMETPSSTLTTTASGVRTRRADRGCGVSPTVSRHSMASFESRVPWRWNTHPLGDPCVS